MSSNSFLIRTIAVAIDCSPHSLASLNTAAELAGFLHANLTGIFVEDINLLRLADIPLSREIDFFSEKTENIEITGLEQLLQIQEQQAETSLQKAAGKFMVKHTFRVCRGKVPEEVVIASLEADLLVLGRRGKSPTCRKGLGSTAQNALKQRKKTVLFMRSGFSVQEESALVLYDGSAASETALDAAMNVIRPGNTLQILMLPFEKNERDMETGLSERFASDMPKIEYHAIPPVTDGKALARYIRMADSGLLFLSDRMNLPSETVHSLVNKIDYPVMVVRG
ncbi:universal stress protein [Chlorobium phaeobacteroides]|uniref:UspA domain protein n=1 Tax=Chlorobium phaeobacteroides (strain DSM 266 / SMG 266 / 2430) TaxID=290317 RepID=A1BID9_CHLPD|nr:universal stress protein [Chlorobium phaeobacteroides]ABL66166.1 UspA domain protein [Chlorobium phaeobacteroides DSM 266]